MPDLYKAANMEKGPVEKQVKAEVVADDPKAVIPVVLRKAGEYKRSELWGAYAIHPGKRFISEQDDEDVVLLLRAHPITNIGWVAASILLLVFPQLVTMTGVLDQFPISYVFVGKLAWFLVSLGFAFEKFLIWFYSVLIVTNERIVDFDFVNLMYREIQSVNLNHIEQPSMVSGGFIRSIFRYGDIQVATAADISAPTVEGKSIPYPEKVIRIIAELSEELEKRRERGE